MSKKIMDKKLLDELIELYRRDYDVESDVASEMHQQCIDKAMELEKKSGVCWCDISSVLWHILWRCGLKPNATNKTIYRVLKELGWEVRNDG